MGIQNIHLRRVFSTIVSSLPIAFIALPSLAAERVIFSYGLLEISIPVDSLETFAREGRIDDKLAPYAQEVSPEELAEVQEILLTPIDVSHVTLSQFLYSSLGEVLLEYLGELIQTDARLNGFYALRSAVVLAAADSEGLTVLNVLRQFPTPALRVNGVRAVQVAGAFTKLLQETEQMIALIEDQAAIEAAASPPMDFSQLPDLRQLGALSWQTETLELYDQSRDRAFETTLYSPSPQPATPMPVVVISHGLGADNTNFIDLAQHLASHGFAVALLQHPGSDTQQLQNLLAGDVSEVIDPQEFIDSPKDVSFLLDELQRRNQSQASQSASFNLQQVGVIGHSFGGYTALALAGAELDFEQLRADCTFEDRGLRDLNLVNLSLLLQCVALDGDYEFHPSLRDDRVQAVLAMNPISGSVFGPRGLQPVQVPVMLVAGSNDPVAPALLEQIRPFTWLAGADKYLVLIQGGTHVYVGSEPSNDGAWVIPEEVVSPDPALARDYLKVSSLAFMQTHVAAQESYQVYLTASYPQAISQPPMKLMLVRTLPATASSALE
ncbi:MAG: alpha/beta hydrolase [Leptolyngbya sp. SIO1E4]|nr:alpha/beta hydrolase [Leptolyngbya sp. SIO1E4]